MFSQSLSPSSAAQWPRLLDTVRNIVVVDGQTELGAVAGCCLAVSPFTRHAQSILLYYVNDNAKHSDAAAQQRRRKRRVHLVEHIKHTMQDGMVQSRSTPYRDYPAQFYYGDVHAPASAVPILLARLRCHDSFSVAVSGSAATSSDDPNPSCDVFVMIFGGVADGQSDVAYDSDPSFMSPEVRLHRFCRTHVRRAHGAAGVDGNTPSKSQNIHVNYTSNDINTNKDKNNNDAHIECRSQVCGRLLLLVDDYARATVEAALRELKSELLGWSVVYVRLPVMSPPGLDLGATEAAIVATQSTAAGWGGVLPSVCAGVITGVTRQLPFARQQSVPFVPIDVALNMALCSIHLLTRVHQHSRERAIANDNTNNPIHRDNGNNNARTVSNTSSSDGYTGNTDCNSDRVTRYNEIMTSFSRRTRMEHADSEVSDAQARPWPAPLHLPHHACPTASHPISHCVSLQLHAQLPVCQSLSWGMFGEYALDYLRRYLNDIRLVFAACDAAIAAAPSLHYAASGLSDILNYGPSQSLPFASLEATRATRTRRALGKRVARSAAQSRYVAHMLQCVNWAGQRLGQLVEQGNPAASVYTGNSPESKDGDRIDYRYHDESSSQSNYVRMLHLMSRAQKYVSLLQCVALYEVDWGMYVRCVCRAVLRHMAGYLSISSVGIAPRSDALSRMNGNASKDCVGNAGATADGGIHVITALPVSRSGHLILPLPTREFTNDFAFRVTGRTPGHPFLWRRLCGDVDWMRRAGMNFTGCRGRMFPGWSSEREKIILSQPSVQRAMRESAAVKSMAQATTSSPSSLSRTSCENTTEQSVSATHDRARKILRHIGDTQSYAQCRLLGIITRQFFFRMFDRIEFSNPDFYERVHRYYNIPRVTVVIVPLHRSYFDFMILTYCLIVMGLPPAHIAAGEDFLRMRKVAELMRATGAFFIRRSFREDVLYSALIKEYVRQLVLHRQSVEFFIEGTRSRTAKTMPPKLGMLKFIVDAFSSSQDVIDDVLFLPVGITYDELPETRIYASELLGIPKPRETVGNLLKACTRLAHNHGCIHLHLGEAISLRSWRASGVSQTHNLIRLAFRITGALQRSIVVTASALVASSILSLSHSRGSTDDSMSRIRWLELCEWVGWLSASVRHRGGLLSIEVQRYTVEQTTRAGLRHLEHFVRLDSPLSSPHRARQSELASTELHVAYTESPPSLSTRLALLIYSNQLAHIFIDEAVLLAAMRRAVSSGANNNSDGGNNKANSNNDDDDNYSSISDNSASAMIARRAEVVRGVRLLHLLLSNEFPQYGDYREHTAEATMHWLDEVVSRVVCDSAPECSSSAKATAATVAAQQTAQDGTWLVTPRSRRSEHLLLQLILPHVEAIFYTAASVYTIAAQLGESEVQPQGVVAALHAVAMRNSAKPSLPARDEIGSMPDQPLQQQQQQLPYCYFCYGDTVVCCKEVLTRYVQTVMQMRAKNDASGLGSWVHGAQATGQSDGEHGSHGASLLHGIVQHVNALRYRPAADVDAEVSRLSRDLLPLYAKVLANHKL